MTEFQAKRVSHEYTQTNIAEPERVFPLLCPVREAEWVPGWKYRLIYSQSGVAELGCVFTTPNKDGSETIWLVTEYDPVQFCIGFVWLNPGLVAAQIRIQLVRVAKDRTDARIRYTYTALSEKGNKELERYDEAWFAEKMRGWEAAINHYLKTGKCVEEGVGE